MDSLLALKTEQDGFEVQFEVISPNGSSKNTDKNQQEIEKELETIDEQYEICEQKVAALNKEIDRLTNHADGLDYTVAVASGILTGVIDSFFVGETNIDIEEIQKKLEKRYHTANDSAFTHEAKDKNGDMGWVSSPSYHRLEDMAHHPTLGGLLAAILVRFFRIAIFSNGDGKNNIFNIGKNTNPDTYKKEIQDMCVAWSLAALSGILVWLASVAKHKYKEEIGEDVPAPLKKLINLIAATPAIIDIMITADTWIGHIMSDVSTSAGVPGIILSFLKEFSMLPIINKTRLPEIVKELYKNEKMNITKYAGVIFVAAKKQSIPVILNEVLVRSFYFIRNLVMEYRKYQNFRDIDWEQVVPFRNRTVERMITIAAGTLTAVDMADAAIRSGGINAACLLRVNFVGVGRFAIAIGTDVGMGIKRGKLQDEKYAMIGQQLDLLNVKISYLDASAQYEMSEAAEEQSFVWKAAEDTVSTLIVANNCVDQAIAFYKESLQESSKTMNKISQHKKALEKNPNLKNEMLNITRWGGQ